MHETAYDCPEGWRRPRERSAEAPRKGLLSLVLRLNNLPQGLLLFRRQIRSLVLRERKEHQEPVGGSVPEVNHSATPTLTPALIGPANFPQASRTGYDVSGCRPSRQMNLKSTILLITQ